MEELFILSGIRGPIDFFSPELIETIAISYGLWLKRRDQNEVIVGCDTRPSSSKILDSVIRGLSKINCKIYDVGTCPSPVIIYTKNQRNISGGIIITGSQNPPNINGLRFLSNITYVNDRELREIHSIAQNLDYSKYNEKNGELTKNIKKIDAIPPYLEDLYSNIPLKKIRENNNLTVVIDTGAGTGTLILPQLLKELGCDVKMLNHQLIDNNEFPRALNLEEKNLKALIKKVWEKEADLGLAYDINTHRLRIVGDDYKCYGKDVSLALIAHYYVNRGDNPCYLVTNIASSLRLDIIAQKYEIKIVKTAIGEFFLALKIDSLMRENPDAFIFGGEGSNGGVMIPEFNNTRDAILATTKIIEQLTIKGRKISSLVSEFPQYYKYREHIEIKGKDIKVLINKIKEELHSEGEHVFQIGDDLRVDNKLENFVLIHPSTTESIIRIIAEARRKSLARILGQTTAKLVRMIIKESE
jgi:phosphomannomutase/phosphoglucomutase